MASNAGLAKAVPAASSVSGVALIACADSNKGREIQQGLRQQGYRSHIATTYAQALERLSENEYDLLAMNIQIWDRHAADFLRAARVVRPQQPVVLVGNRRQVKKALELVGTPRLYSLAEMQLGRALGEALVESEVGLRSTQSEALYAMLEASRLLAEGSEVTSAIEVMLPPIADVSQAAEVLLYTRQLEEDDLSYCASYPPIEDPLELMSLPRIIPERTVELGETVAFTLESEGDALAMEMTARNIKRAVGLPMVWEGRMVGALVLIFRTVEEDGPIYLDQVQDLTRWITIILQLYQIERAYKVMKETSATQEEDVTLRGREVESLNRMLQTQISSYQEMEERVFDVNSAQMRLLRTMGHLINQKNHLDGQIDKIADWLADLDRELGLNSPSLPELAYLYNVGHLVDNDEDAGADLTTEQASPDEFAPFRTTGDMGLTGQFDDVNRNGAKDTDQSRTRQTILGAQFLEQLRFPDSVVKAVRHQHESFDGTGQPDRLSGESIPIESRLLRVVDSFLSITHGDGSEESVTPLEARAYLIRESGRAFDPRVIQAFFQILDRDTPVEGPESQVISTISHELRSPLTYLLGYSELLSQSPDLPRDAAEHIRELREEAVHMSRLLEQIVDVTKLENKGSISKAEVDLAQLVSRAVRQVDDFATGAVANYIGPDQREIVRGDETLLTQLMDNLLNNAVKYSPRGGRIEVELTRSLGEYTVRVTDQGIGIPADALEQVFDKFYRVENQATSQVRGSGLGLSLCKGIVEAHEGVIWVESVEGQGSTFIFTLPAAS